jgi:ankyrin repeat protein
MIVKWSRTALIEAALKGRSDTVRVLVQAGADKEAKDDVRVKE